MARLKGPESNPLEGLKEGRQCQQRWALPRPRRPGRSTSPAQGAQPGMGRRGAPAAPRQKSRRAPELHLHQAPAALRRKAAAPSAAPLSTVRPLKMGQQVGTGVLRSASGCTSCQHRKRRPRLRQVMQQLWCQAPAPAFRRKCAVRRRQLHRKMKKGERATLT